MLQKVTRAVQGRSQESTALVREGGYSATVKKGIQDRPEGIELPLGEEELADRSSQYIELLGRHPWELPLQLQALSGRDHQDY